MVGGASDVSTAESDIKSAVESLDVVTTWLRCSHTDVLPQTMAWQLLLSSQHCGSRYCGIQHRGVEPRSQGL